MKKATKKTKKQVNRDTSQSVSSKTKHTKHTVKNKQTGEAKVLRDAHGRLLPGGASINPNGRGKNSSFMDEFRLALKTVELKKRMTLLEHFIEKAWDNDRILVACIDRILPALKAVEIHGVVGMVDTEEAKKIQDELRRRFTEC